MTLNSRIVGFCIYCRRSDVTLSREHVVPAGLNGDWTLRKASCTACAKITAKIEQDALRNAFFGPRAALGMRTRRPKERPKSFPLQVETAGRRHVIQVPLQDYPVYIALPLFELPTHLSGKPSFPGIRIRAAAPVHLAGPTFDELKARYRYDYVGIRLEYQPVLFARMLAKIGLGMTFLAAGPHALSEDYVVPNIMGRAQDIGRWVGSEDTLPVNPTHGLHAVTVMAEGGEIRARIRLFAQFHQAEYVVVVGKTAVR